MSDKSGIIVVTYIYTFSRQLQVKQVSMQYMYDGLETGSFKLKRSIKKLFYLHYQTDICYTAALTFAKQQIMQKIANINTIM